MATRIIRLALIISVSLLISCASSQKQQSTYAPPEYWPSDGWRVSTPEEQGMDSRLLAEAVDFARTADFGIHSLLVIRNGYIVTDAYFYPFAPDTPHDLASCTKSFSSTLIGIAIANGYIEGVQQPVLSFFPERTVANIDENKEAMTLEDLLTMRTGMACYASNNEITLFQMMSSPDWTQFMLDLPMLEEPGTRFEYCSGGSHLLSVILRQATGMDALEFGRKSLFGPLGISDVGWPYDPQGENNHGWGDLRLKPHDMAKLGFLFLNRGVWDGEQIVSPEWVVSATGNVVRLSRGDFLDYYGYQWWIGSRGFFSARGRGGQIIFVVPEQNMVVVLTGGAGGPKVDAKRQTLAKKFLLPAVKSNSALPPDQEGVSLLQARIDLAAKSSDGERVTPEILPATAQSVSGQTYIFDHNPFALKSFSLTFEGDNTSEAVFCLSMLTGETVEFLVGLDNVYRFSPGRYGIPAALKGEWEREDAFVIQMNEVGNINNWLMTYIFEGAGATVVMKESTGLGETMLRAKAQ